MDLHARGTVATDRPDRYAAQLAKHLGHRLETRWDGERGEIRFPDGGAVCTIAAAPPGLVFEAAAPDDAMLERVKDVVKRHLERFGERENLVVDWEGDRQTVPSPS